MTAKFRKEVRRKLYQFTRKVATVMSDTRRQRFVEEMIVGVVVSGKVHLTEVARAASYGTVDVHAAEKRLSRHLNSEHWDTSSLTNHLLELSSQRVDDNSLIVVDLTDVAKPFSRKLEGLGRVRDASDPDGRLVPGYVLLEAYVRVGRWQMFPLLIVPLKTYSGAATSENTEICEHLRTICDYTGGRGIYVLDRGADRRELFQEMLQRQLAFLVRLRGDRHIITQDGRKLSVCERAHEILSEYSPKRCWPHEGLLHTEPVQLPDFDGQEFLLVLFWIQKDHEPLMLLVSPQARKKGRTGWWFVKAYRRRWGVEDATRSIKQQFSLEQFLVRSWRSICRLLCFVGLAFYWLNSWGEESYNNLLERLLNHPSRLPKQVTYLFNGVASQIRQLLRPKLKIPLCGYFDTG